MSELHTVLRHVLSSAFVVASVASAWQAVSATGPIRWLAIVGIVICAWSASWIERSRKEE